ncbi:MAG: HD domain-containing protein, partial [Methanomassiliicoccales archaeon]
MSDDGRTLDPSVIAPRLGRRTEEALSYALAVHGAQVRKSLPVPYVSHLLAVASLVLEDGGDEEQVVAALLHDAAED